MSTVRIYAANGEPFDVPEHKVGDLVLNKGFSQTPHDPDAEPAVKTVPVTRKVKETIVLSEDAPETTQAPAKAEPAPSKPAPQRAPAQPEESAAA